MANDAEVSEKAANRGGGAGRGPSYPALSIEQAIAKAMQFWAAEKRGAAPLAAAAKHWGYSETSSSGKMVAAALLHYGLLQDEGSKAGRTVKLTGRGLDIVLDAQDSPQRRKAISDAVWSPRLYADILSKWSPQELPSDQTLRYYLLREKGFNDSTVDSFIKDFRASIEYAGLYKTPTIPVSSAASDTRNPENLAFTGSDPEIGDMIQWESSGVLRLDAPRRVRAKQEHQGRWWVFVDGSETGIPMEEATLLERKPSSNDAPSGGTPPVLQLPSMVASPQLEVGEQVLASAKLGKGKSYRLAAVGDITAKDLDRIIKLLEALKEQFDDDEL